MTTPATVFVIDDDAAVRESLERLLRANDLRVETFDSADAFLHSGAPERPGCVVLDLRMPGTDGLELQSQLASRENAQPVIMISAHGEIDSAVRAMRGGAVDFIRKPFRPQELIERIREALELDRTRRESAVSRKRVQEALARLTPREREVCDRMVHGRSAKEIALELGLSRKTVDIHRAHVLMKLNAESVVQLVRLLNDVGG